MAAERSAKSEQLQPLPDTNMRIGGRAKWRAIEMFLQFNPDVPPEEISKIIRTGVDQLLIRPRIVGEFEGEVDFNVDAVYPDLQLVVEEISHRYQQSRAYRQMRIDELAEEASLNGHEQESLV
ncbi:MAG: hypothetical protein AAB373_02875 [Patescibacteria group bacterium]